MLIICREDLTVALIVFSIFLYPHADESVEKWSLQSTDSSQSVNGYLADRENSSSLSSLQVCVGETYNEGNLEEEQGPQVLQGWEELEICLGKLRKTL